MARKISKVKSAEIMPQSMQSNRKLLRRILKNRIGSNKIRGAWHQFQKARYGSKEHQIIKSLNLTLIKRRAKSALFR